MDVHDFNYNNKDYTLVDTYKVKDGVIVQLNSDDDIILFFVDKNGQARILNQKEDEEFRKKHNLIDYGYVTATFNDIKNFEFSAKKLDEEKVKYFKRFFKNHLAKLDPKFIESPYINKRINDMKYRINGKCNAYLSNTVYLSSKKGESINKWIITHETIHGIVDKSHITTYGMIEGITDMMVAKMLPNGNYSRNYQLIGGEIQINDYGFGQDYLVVFAKQLEYALGENFNLYEMLTHPHKQIKEFGKIYGSSKCRVLMHKINKLYHDCNIENFKIAQEYMLNMIFDKKFENVINEETAKVFFEELQNFGLLRGRIEGKDDSLKEYYNQKKEELNNKKIDSSKVSEYNEKKFNPCGDCYFRYNSYIESSVKLRKEGKGENFQILYNNDNTCVYLIVDGKLSHIQNDSIDNKRRFFVNMITDDNSKVLELPNGNYLITGPDGITEEVYDTNANEIIDSYFVRNSNKKK